MKCKNSNCANDVPERLQNKGQVYCSRDCAPLGNYGISKNTSSAPDRGSSSFTDDGSRLASSGSTSASSDGLPRSERSEPQESLDGTSADTLPRDGKDESKLSANTSAETKSGSKKMQDVAELTGPTSSASPTPEEIGPGKDEILNDRERSGMTGIAETEKSKTEKNARGDESESLPAVSSPQPTNLDEARYRSMSLIDESSSLLLDCMKSNVRKRDDGSIRDYREINSIANLGKQIASLAKVKLDAIKEARRK